MAKKIDVERYREIMATVDALQAALNRLRSAVEALSEEMGVPVESGDMTRLVHCLFHKLLKPAPGERVPLTALHLAYANALFTDTNLSAIAKGCGYNGTNRDPVWKALRLLAMEQAERVVNLQNRLFLVGFALKDDVEISELCND